ncbi:hypothetical protein [Candidatus Uabimicrobium amorphum]|uniref:DUF5667 domain-containing protein n=1 Tax=Uabimicrobium amorphum TaxID=2596890 RepID=A0A5S9IL83_UABAM|nr:hypothetical protein [Candidatus Uabimicrobium amorphum]BBM83506.1 hypothetical protein UABAM_01858 [Candidatus Uabimicrobium amorphum]
MNKLLLLLLAVCICSCAGPGGFFSARFVLKVGDLNYTDDNGQTVSQDRAKYEWIFSYDKNVADEQQQIAKKAESKVVALRQGLRNKKLSVNDYKSQNEKLSNAMKNLEDKGREKVNDGGFNSLTVEKEFIDAWYDLKNLVK